MKKLVVALAALALSAPALAQQTGGQFGLGVSITPESSFSPTVEVYFPMNIAPNLRLEPSIGIFSVDNPSTSGAGDRRDLTLGAGLFFTQKVAPVVDMYMGGRLKLNFANNDPGDSGTDFLLAGAAGGEWYVVPKFSLGMEAQLGFFSASEASGDQSGFFTTGLGFMRVYF